MKSTKTKINQKDEGQRGRKDEGQRGRKDEGQRGQSPTSEMATCSRYEAAKSSRKDWDSVEEMIASDTSERSLKVFVERAARDRKKFLSKRRRQPDVSPDSDNSEVSAKAPKVSPTRRGRGRPPTTGMYVGLAKAKQELIRAEREEMQLRAEREVESMTRQARILSTPRDLSMSEDGLDRDGDIMDTATLLKKVRESVSTIMMVATKSANLKGGFVRSLKESAKNVEIAAVKLCEQTATEETKALQALNKRLNDELARVSQELRELKEEQSRMRDSQRQPPATELIEELKRSIMIEVGSMMSARLSSYDERLPPAERVRPPLAADRARNANIGPTQPLAEALNPRTERIQEKGKTERKKKENVREKGNQGIKKNSKGEPQSRLPAMTPQSKPQPTNPQEEDGQWIKVGKKGKKERKQQEKKTAKRKKKAVPELRVPRSAAVVINLEPTAQVKGITYANILRRAKEHLDIQSLGIKEGLSIRETVSGARIIEVPGAKSNPQADTIADTLRRVFKEEIRVSRPMKCGDLRLTNLDDSVTPAEIAEAISKTTECPLDNIKVGIIRRHRRSQGSVWVRCPVATANTLVKMKRLTVGWSAAKVALLQPRTLRCYRCMEVGHVKQQCTSEVDRSNLCYRCAQPDHKVENCTADPYCSVCEAAGRPASHRVGAKSCIAHTAKGKKRGGSKAKLKKAQPPTGKSTVEEMATEIVD